MSWGRSTAGAPAHVLAAVPGWAGEVAAIDCALDVAPAIAAAHQRQVAQVVETVKAFVAAVPPGFHLAVSGHGHHNGEDADRCGLRVECYNPVPIMAAGFTP